MLRGEVVGRGRMDLAAQLKGRYQRAFGPATDCRDRMIRDISRRLKALFKNPAAMRHIPAALYAKIQPIRTPSGTRRKVFSDDVVVLMTGQNIAETIISAEQALPVGAMLCGDQFTITEHLGAGGFGITYRARDNVLGRTIVIKECFPTDLCYRNGRDVAVRNRSHGEQMRSIISMFMREAQCLAKLRHPNVVGVHRAFEENNTAYMALDLLDEEFPTLQREARSLAKLRHPNIVGVHRAFEENETAYMVLDLIDGRDLSDILETDAVPLSPGRVKDILLQLLDAIEKVHEVDLLHRDISPDNILIEKSGTPVLIDFGAARGDASRHTRAVSSLLVVKDGYSPQELYVAGSEQTPSSDLYALAATFYHVVSGEAPVNSQTRMIEIAGNNPDPCVPLAGRIEGYEPAFLEAIDTAMQVHPSKRLQTAAKWRSLIADAEGVAGGLASGVRPSSKDLSLELEVSLTRLVEETNDEVRRISQIPPESKEAEKPAATIEASSRPEWVDEFNRESLSRPSEPVVEERAAVSRDTLFDASAAGGAVDAPVASGEAKSQTNWIGRAKEKQKRIRQEQARRLEIFDAETDSPLPTKPLDAAEEAIDEVPQAVPPVAERPNKYRPLSILFLLICFYFVFFLETP